MTKEPTDPPRITTLTQLFTEYATPKELCEDLDYTMLCLMLLLKYEPHQSDTIIEPYQTLRELRNLIQQHNTHP